MDILTKKKAAPKAPRAAPREESPPSEATAAVAKKPGPPRGRKATKRLTSSSDSDSDFGSRPSKSVAAKVCRLPHVCAEGAPGCRVLFWWKRGGSRSSSQWLMWGAGWEGHTVLGCVFWAAGLASSVWWAAPAVAAVRAVLTAMCSGVWFTSWLLSLQKSKRDDDDSYSIDLTADSPAAAAPRTRPGRLKKPVQYLESSDEDDMFWVLWSFKPLGYGLSCEQSSFKLQPRNRHLRVGIFLLI